MVGVGIGGNMTEIVDDVTFTRAPIDANGAYDLVGQLRTVRKHPDFLTETQRRSAADFIGRFSALVASAPWRRFTLEVNPLKLDTIEPTAEGGLRIGALVRNTVLAADERVRRDYGVLSRALLAGAVK